MRGAHFLILLLMSVILFTVPFSQPDLSGTAEWIGRYVNTRMVPGRYIATRGRRRFSCTERRSCYRSPSREQGYALQKPSTRLQGSSTQSVGTVNLGCLYLVVKCPQAVHLLARSNRLSSTNIATTSPRRSDLWQCFLNTTHDFDIHSAVSLATNTYILGLRRYVLTLFRLKNFTVLLDLQVRSAYVRSD